MKILSLDGLTYFISKFKAWVTDNFSTKTELSDGLATKQSTLTAGSNITISGSTISAKDTTYSTASTSTAGLMSASDKSKLDGIATGATKITVDSSLSSSSTNPVQNKVINSALSGKLSTSGTAVKATADASGNNIVDTYETKANAITGLSVSGRTITYTKGDGATGTITTQDNNTDTKNTTGTSNKTATKLFLAGATSQATNPVTYSNSNVYIGTDNKLYSGGKVVIASGDNATSATSATKATQDASGNVITDTYETKANAITGLSVSGKVITYTKGDGSTGTITTQDTNTDTKVTQTNSTGTSAYPILLKNGTGTGTVTNGVLFDDGVTIQPSTGTVTATTFKGALTGNVTGNCSGSSGSCTGNSATATKATQDASGNVIASTYETKANAITGLSVSGKVITYTKGDGDTGTITTQDTNTTYSAGTGMSLSGTTFNHSNSITAGSIGSATAIPVITYDAQGHITAVSTKTIYPPTSAGTSGQYWKSDGSGAGAWQTLSTSPTSGSAVAITSGAVYTALASKASSSHTHELSVTETLYTHTTTSAGTVTYTVSAYTSGKSTLDVYINGLKATPTVDYTIDDNVVTTTNSLTTGQTVLFVVRTISIG